MLAAVATATDAVPPPNSGRLARFTPHGVRRGDLRRVLDRHHARRGGCRGTLELRSRRFDHQTISSSISMITV